MHEQIEFNDVIKRIRKGLQERTGRAWSVTRGRGTSYCWINITAPNARLVCSRTSVCGPDCSHYRGYLSADDMSMLALALGLERMHNQGESIPASNGHHVEFVDRAEGRKPRVVGVQYWD